MAGEVDKIAGTQVTFTVPDTETLGSLDSMKPGVNLNMSYRKREEWEAVRGQPTRVFYMGCKQIPNETGELVWCGLFVNAKEVFLAGGMLLIEVIKSLPIKTALQLTYLGVKPTKEGKEMLNIKVDRLG